MTYTSSAVLGVVLTVLLDVYVLRTRLLTRRSFWVAYAVVVFFQLVTNGILTGRRIVTYDPSVVVGGAQPRLFGDGRIVYAPLEDLLFGFALVVQTLAWWVWWGRRLREGAPRDSSRDSSRD